MKVLVDIDRKVSATYRIVLKVLEIEPSKLHPEGIKAKYVIINMKANKPVFLIDNHEPFGFHSHPDPGLDHNVRLTIPTRDYSKAMDIFFEKVKEILANENT